MAFISGLLFAAGLSSRMSGQKLFLTYKGKALIHHSLNNLINSKVDEILIVIEENAEAEKQLKEILSGYLIERKVLIIKNRNSAAGLSSSMKLGISHASPESDGFLFLLADLPFVSSDIINKAIAGFSEKPSLNLACRYSGKRGHPVIFAKKWKAVLLQVNGDRGGRTVLRDYPEEIQYLDFSFSRPLFDVDTPEDYEKLQTIEDLSPETELLSFLQEIPYPCISISGGGGKTSLMLYLAGKFREMGKRVLISTTTHLMSPELCRYDQDLLYKSEVWDFDDEKLPSPGICLWYGGFSKDRRKIHGPPLGELEKAVYKSVFDAVILETDGSLGIPVKAAGEHEPVIPDFADTCLHVIGLSGFGKPADERSVHRMESFRKMISDKHCTIDEKVLAVIIDHPSGAFKNAPAKSRKTVFLNQCDAVTVEARLRLKKYLQEQAALPEVFVFTKLRENPEVIDIVRKHY